MNSARLMLVGLIGAVPTILLLDGPIVQALVASTLAAGVAVVGGKMREKETEFLLATIRPIAVLATMPAIWMIFQIVPLKAGSGLAHPIWQSAEEALGHPISGSISVDPGATLIALGQYLCAVAVMLMAAAVAADRERAEWILFALVAASALVALVLLGHDILGVTFLSENGGAGSRAQARACVALGLIFAITGSIRTFERYETRHHRADRSPTLIRTFMACTITFVLCLVALALNDAAGVLFVAGYGMGALLAVVAIRRIGLSLWGDLALGVVGAAVAIALIGAQPTISGADLTLRFASGEQDGLISTTRLMLADVPWMGTGAGTFSLLLPIYRDAGDVTASLAAPTTAAKIAIELGQPILWAILVALTVGIFVLLRGSLSRGRDSFYPAAGASAMLLLMLLAFCDDGALGMPVAICAAAILGLAFVQRKSRTVT